MGKTMRMRRTHQSSSISEWENHEDEKNSSEFFDMRGCYHHNFSEVKGNCEECQDLHKADKR
jgi:hypothetical protein